MSGLKHVLGRTTYHQERSGDPLVAVDFPAIEAGDREFASRSVWHSGHQRGRADARVLLSRRHDFPPADPVPAKHLKLHCSAALKAIAPGIKLTALSASALQSAWLDGYQAGFDSLQAGGVHGMMGEGGDPDGGE